MKNLIVIGDSFCSDPKGWPETLANKLELNLICHGQGGQPWWNARTFITALPSDTIDNAEYIVFAHTNKDRIPTSNEEIGKIDHSKPPKSEIEQAIHLYFKYIQDPGFIGWAHEQWFIEISRVWGHKKLCHLHCFPWTVSSSHLLTGLNIDTNLTALSLNELGVTHFNLFNDKRTNHFNQNNNYQLALQLAERLENYDIKSVSLDVNKFDQATSYWLDIGTRWP